jgi:topoisomerase-4 subunit A
MLLAHTSLETGPDQPGDDRRRRPSAPEGPVEILQEWIDFRFVTVTPPHRVQAGKVNDRIHILEGREIVLLNIDKVIAIIRNSDEPKAALIERLQPVRPPGRGHPRDPPAPAGAPGSDQDPAGAGRAARRKGKAARHPRQSVVDEAPDHPRDRSRRQAVRRRPPHPDRRSAEGRGRAEGRRRAGHGDRLRERLGARAHRHRPRHPAQFTFKAGDSLYGAPSNAAPSTTCCASATTARPIRCRWPPCPARAATACRSRPWSTCRAACASCTTSQARRHAPAAGDLGRLRLHRQGRRHGQPPEGRQVLHHAGRRRRAAGAARGGGHAGAIACLSEKGRVLVFGIDEMKVLTNGGRGVT